MLLNSKKNNVFIFWLVGVCLLSIFSPSIAADRSVEYKVKAAYLYNFLKFVKWPDSNLATDTSEIIICVLGQSELDSFLKPITRLQAQGRSIKLVAVRNLAQARHCQLLFVGDTDSLNAVQIMEGLKDADYLTVGESKNFAARGGMIGFVFKQGKVRLEINAKAAKRANLQISAKLLEIAELVP